MSNDLNPVSIRNDKMKTTGSEKANFSKSTYHLHGFFFQVIEENGKAPDFLA